MKSPSKQIEFILRRLEKWCMDYINSQHAVGSFFLPIANFGLFCDELSTVKPSNIYIYMLIGFTIYIYFYIYIYIYIYIYMPGRLRFKLWVNYKNSADIIKALLARLRRIHKLEVSDGDEMSLHIYMFKQVWCTRTQQTIMTSRAGSPLVKFDRWKIH